MFKLIKQNKLIIQKGGTLNDMVVDDMFNVNGYNQIGLNITTIDGLFQIDENDIDKYSKYADNLLQNDKFNKYIRTLVDGVYDDSSLNVSQNSLILLNYFVDAELTVLLSKLIKINQTEDTSFPSKFKCNFDEIDVSLEESCKNLHLRNKIFSSNVNENIENLSYDTDLAQDSIYGLFTMLNVKSPVIGDDTYYHSSVTKSLVDLLEKIDDATNKIYLVLKNKDLTYYYITQSKLNFLVSHFEISDKKSYKNNEELYDFSKDKYAFVRALVYSVFDDHYNYYTSKLRITDGKLYEILTLFIRYRVEYIEQLIMDNYTDKKKDLLAFKVFNSNTRVKNNYYYRYHYSSYSGRKIGLLEKLNGELFDDILKSSSLNILKPIFYENDRLKESYKIVIDEKEINFILEQEKEQETEKKLESETPDNIIKIVTFNVYNDMAKNDSDVESTFIKDLNRLLKPSVIFLQEVNDIKRFGTYQNMDTFGKSNQECVGYLTDYEIEMESKITSKYSANVITKRRSRQTMVSGINDIRNGFICEIKDIKIANLHLAGGKIIDTYIIKAIRNDDNNIKKTLLAYKIDLLNKILENSPDIIVGVFNIDLETYDNYKNTVYTNLEIILTGRELDKVLIDNLNNDVITILEQKGYKYARPENYYQNGNKYTSLDKNIVTDGMWYNPTTIEPYGDKPFKIFNHVNIKKDDTGTYFISDHYPVFGSFKIKQALKTETEDSEPIFNDDLVREIQKIKSDYKPNEASIYAKQLYDDVYYDNFKFPDWVNIKWNSHDFKDTFLLYDENDTLNDVYNVALKREPVNIKMNRQYHKDKMKEYFKYETGYYENSVQTKLMPNIAVYCYATIKRKKKNPGDREKKVHVLNLIGCALDVKEQPDRIYMYNKSTNPNENSDDFKKDVKPHLIEFYRKMWNYVPEAINILRTKNIKIDTVLLHHIGSKEFADIFKKPNDEKSFVEDIEIPAQTEMRIILNKMGVKMIHTGTNNITHKVPDIFFKSKDKSKPKFNFNLKQTLFLNAWDPWTIIGNGNSRDDTLDGYWGRYSNMSVLGWGFTNPYMKFIGIKYNEPVEYKIHDENISEILPDLSYGNFITLNCNGEFGDETVSIPDNTYVLIPHKYGLDINYTLSAVEDQTFENILYIQNSILDFGYGWKLYGPKDQIKNHNYLPFGENDTTAGNVKSCEEYKGLKLGTNDHPNATKMKQCYEQGETHCLVHHTEGQGHELMKDTRGKDILKINVCEETLLSHIMVTVENEMSEIKPRIIIPFCSNKIVCSKPINQDILCNLILSPTVVTGKGNIVDLFKKLYKQRKVSDVTNPPTESPALAASVSPAAGDTDAASSATSSADVADDTSLVTKTPVAPVSPLIDSLTDPQKLHLSSKEPTMSKNLDNVLYYNKFNSKDDKTNMIKQEFYKTLNIKFNKNNFYLSSGGNKSISCTGAGSDAAMEFLNNELKMSNISKPLCDNLERITDTNNMNDFMIEIISEYPSYNFNTQKTTHSKHKNLPPGTVFYNETPNSINSLYSLYNIRGVYHINGFNFTSYDETMKKNLHIIYMKYVKIYYQIILEHFLIKSLENSILHLVQVPGVNYGGETQITDAMYDSVVEFVHTNYQKLIDKGLIISVDLNKDIGKEYNIISELLIKAKAGPPVSPVAPAATTAPAVPPAGPLVPLVPLVPLGPPATTPAAAGPHTHQLYNGSSIPSLPHLLYSLTVPDPNDPNKRIIDQTGLNILTEEIYKQYPGATHVWIL